MDKCTSPGLYMPETHCDNCAAILEEVRKLRDLLDQIETQVSDKQDKLTPGDNINITLENVISALVDAYEPGENIQINGKVISATDTTYSQGTGVVISGTNVISAERNANNTFTKDEVLDLLANLEHPHLREVQTLPATGDDNTIYLVPNPGGGYEMYLWVNNEWKDLGKDEIDLSEYSKKEETIKSITRNLLQYVATRADGTTFTFDAKAIMPVNPSTPPTENGAMWITT